MPFKVGPTYLTTEDLERERAALRNVNFGPELPLWRRVLCRVAHWRWHSRAPIHHSSACRCTRCGHAWMEHD